MLITGLKRTLKSGLVTLIAGAVFLLPVKNALADANLSSSLSSFISADPARSNSYMDSAGVWNGTTEVTNTTGDTFRLTVINSASGNNATEIQNNTAYGVAITANVAAGFRLPVSPFNVTVTELSGNAGCAQITAQATQPGGTGTTINFNALSGGVAADILPGCEYQFDLGLTTSTVAPYVASGSYNVDYNITWSNFDNTPTNPSQALSTTVEVRGGDVAIVKTSTSAGPVADGATATFEVSVIAASQGGIFNVVVTDVLGPDFDPASLQMSSVSGGSFVSPDYIIPYIFPDGNPIIIEVQADVQVDPNAVSCPVLSNTVNVIERTQRTDTSTDAAAFDLQEPLLTFTAPDITIPLNGGPITVSVPITNSGTGTAKNISLAVPGTGTDLDSFSITVTSPNWSFDSVTDLFTYTGTIAAGVTETLTFTLETAVCPPPAGGTLDWSLSYQNVCGTAFNPASQSSNLSVGNVPDATISKTASTGALNVGQAASYTLALNGTNLSGLTPNDTDNTNNNDFTVADTFPPGISNIAIPTIPAGTEVEVQGVGIFTGSVPAGQIPENGTIFWRGDVVDLQATPSMQVDFNGGGTGVCPTGQNINNTASLSTVCSINDTDTIGFILNENPAGGAVLNISVTGGPFEAGAPDTNNINRDEPREGEHIPFSVSYAFPVGYEAGAINWSNLQFNAELRTGAATGSPLVLTNNRQSVLLTVTSGGAATLCTQQPLIPVVHFSGGDGVDPLFINDFGFVPALCGVGNVVDDVSLLLEYMATSPEGDMSGGDPYNGDPLNDNNIGTYLENTSLDIVGATPGCTGTTTFTQAVAVNIERADLDLTGNINNGNNIEVCSVVPVTVNLNELVPDTTADNLLFNLGLTNLQIVDGASNPSTNVDADISRSGGFADAGFTLNTPPADNQGPIEYQLLPNTTNLSGPGVLSFNARVLDIGTAFNARVSFDSKHTSPDAGGDPDQDYSFTLNDAPTNFLRGDLDLEFFPPGIILRDQTNYSFRAHIVNTGDGAAVNGIFEITLPPEMNYVSSTSSPAINPPVISGQTLSWDLSSSTLGDLDTGEFIDIDINVAITQQSCFQGGVPDQINSLTNWGCGISNEELLPNTPPIILPTAQLTLSHDLNHSFCELCEVGEVHLLVRNTGGLLLTDVEVVEDLLLSGLELVPGSVSCISDEGTCNVAVQPVQTGTTINFTPTHIPMLSDLYSAFSTAPNTPQQIEIIFQVQRPVGFLENIVIADLSVAADAQYGLFCDQLSASPVRISAPQDRVVLPLRQPAPTIQKQARNVTANQNVWTDTVYGGTADQVIWRIDIQNLGDADLQDLKLDDIISQLPVTAPINFDFHSLCPTEADADASAAAAGTAGACQAMTDPQQILPPLDDIDFSGTAVDIPQGSNQYIYLVGVILNQCENMLNTSSMDWGCEAESPPVGGIISLPGGPAQPVDTANLSARVDPNGISISQSITGVNPTTGNRVAGSPVGSKGMVQLTITNNSGGTIRNLQFSDTLPPNYQYDSSRPIEFNFTPAYLDYLGNVDTITEDATSTPTVPVFNLTTTGATNLAPLAIHNNVLRNGDRLVIRYGIVRSGVFDTEAHPEVREETGDRPNNPPVSGYDVPYVSPENNRIVFAFDDTCDVNAPFPDIVDNQNATINPEDLDVDINSTDPELFYVLGNPFAFLDLTAEFTNNGGRPATDYQLIVTIGEGLNVTTVPAGCVANGTVGAPTVPVKPILDPPPVLNSAFVYLCSNNDPLAPGATDSFTFRVQKGLGTDLTFRADAVGEVTLFDGTGTGNNYSFDAVLARIIGFDLKKSVQVCSERPPYPAGTQAINGQIGEDCVYKVDVAWFGFATPGFGQIEIGQFDITDTIPAGQGFIQSVTSSGGGGAVDLTPETLISVPPAVTAPNEVSSINWRYNYDNTAGQIDNAITDDVTLSFELTTRVLNTASNNRNEVKTDTTVATFEVDFDGSAGPMAPRLFDSSSANYPPLTDRQVAQTVSEPNLVISKRVCNRTLELDGVCNAGNPADPNDYGDFSPTVNGDADDVYVFMIRLYNDNSIPSVAPAFDISVLDTLDAMSTPTLLNLATDGKDNNRDGVVDDAAETGIPSYTAPQISFTPGAISLLTQIDPGQAIDLFYQVDISDVVVPGQTINNTASANYDSLLGASGNQNNPQRPNDDIAGARTYTAGPANASILIANVVAPVGSKAFTNKSNIADLPFTGAPPYVMADAVVGEEVEVELRALIPISTLKNFRVQDIMPSGLSCIEAGDLILPNQSEVTPGDLYFVPGGRYPVQGCDALSNTPVWQATVDQTLVAPGAPYNRTFDLRIPMIARVDNIAAVVAGAAITNGGSSTNVEVSFLDEFNNPVSIPLGAATVNVKEPAIQLTIRTGTPNATPPPYVNAITAADSADIYTVEVVVTNASAVPANDSGAYNLQLVADLSAVPGAIYVPGSLAGPDAANFTLDTVNSGPTQLVLDYNNPKLDPAASQTISFDVQLPNNLQPHDVLQTSVTANYTSLPGNTTALNSTGSIGADGDPDGMRVYSVTQTDTTASVPGLQITKMEDALSDPVPTIGARKRFQLQLNFPEGITRGGGSTPLQIIDNLAATGSSTSYVLENNASYVIVYEFSGIQSINGISDPAQFASQITPPADGSTGAVIWQINGDVVTDTENDLDGVANVINPYIRITYYARIDDNPTTVAGATLLNSALGSYYDRASTPRATPPQSVGPFTVVEPDLRMMKTANPTINYGTPETYTLDIRNVGGSTAWNSTISDVLIEPALGGMCDTPPANISAAIYDAANVLQRPLVLNTDFDYNFAPDPVCTLTLNMLTPDAGIESGWSLRISYDAELDLDNANGTTLDNIAGVTRYYSLEQVNDSARTYSNTLSPTYDLANATTPYEDYEDAFRITVGAPQLDITQSVIDLATVPGVLAPPILAPTARPGDTVRYQIHIVNQGPIAINGFDLIEDLDLLNPGAGYYQSGSLNILYAANGTDFSNVAGGSKGTGLIDIRNLNIAAANAGNTDELFIQYDITLAPVITSGTQVLNQSQANIPDFSSTPILSDDPDPALPGDADPTVLTVNSIPSFKLLKTSQDMSGDLTILQAGDILRYTISAQNVGAEDSVNTRLRDQIPANTRYVANSTTLNGVAVADPADGVSPLQDGMLINAPENTTPGYMRADKSASASNIATITFDVQLDANVVNGTVISNQALVGGDGVGSAPYAEQPSDDPDTEIVGDPTRDVVGRVAVLDAQKTVELYIDNGTENQVDPGDTLRYTIVINNSGTVDATNVVLTDNLPPYTSYVAGSTTLNGVPVADGAGGTLPIIGGLPVSSSDLTPPLPGAGQGTISPMQAATLVFDVTVNPLTADGTIISNQGLVTSAEFPDEPTDEDGNDINGDQPTRIIVGNTQRLSISKLVSVVGGGTAQPGAILEYFINVENTGFSAIDLSDITQVLKVFDDIDQANLLTYVPGSARLNGVSDPNIVFDAPRLYVHYDNLKRASPNPLFNPGDKFTIRYLAQIDVNAAQGVNINNTAALDWGSQTFIPVNNANPINCTPGMMNVDACASIDIDVGGAPGVATLSGSLWHDSNLDEIQDSTESVLAGWEVQVYFGAGTVNPGDYLDSVYTDASGNYSVLGLIPNDAGALQYALQFRPPQASTDTASLGQASIPAGVSATTGPSRVLGLSVSHASHTSALNLPIQPNGVLYDSLLRTPVNGAVLRMSNANGVDLPVSCFNDPLQQNQRAVYNGLYKFDLNFSQAGVCDPGMDYIINVFPPPGYIDYDNDPSTPNVSLIIPPARAITDAAYDAINCPGNALPGPECGLQASEQAPTSDVPPRTAATDYYQKFTFANNLGDDQIFNNHIALDPSFNNAIAISKTSPLVNVTRGQLVPYDISLTNTLDAPFYDLNVEDLFPAGFKYIAGSARVQFANGSYVKTEPVYDSGSLTLRWENIGKLDSKSTLKLKLLLVVGSGVGEGEYVNRAQARNSLTGNLESGQASATVRVVPDPTFDCTDVIGKVFDDKNLNAYQDEGEEGIPDVRVITARGLEITSDAYGRFHIACAVVPNPDRGSNFILKLDERSLPSGYRLTTENPRVVRATRGKMVKFSFGAAIHHVVRLDMADAVFEPGTTQMRPQWLPRMDLLITELAKDPSLLRLSYLAENEPESLVNDRLQVVKDEIEKRWQELNCCYRLMIETEVFWRKGGPQDRGVFDE